MKPNRKARLALWTAIVALPIAGLSGAAFAQQRVGSEGHALDASNQIGSGGVNVSQVPNTAVGGNQIVTGNVTGGFQFRGRHFHGIDLGPGYTDPSAFRGLLPGMMVDQFVRQSAGSPTNDNPISLPSRTPSAFYGQSNTAALPPGFVKLESGGGYVPAPAVNASQIQNTSLDPLVAPMTALPKPGELLLPGPLDVTADTVFSASPLYGTRQWQLNNNSSDNVFSAEEGMQFSPSGPVEQGRAANLSRVQQYRNELNQSVSPAAGGPANGTINGQGNGAGNGTGGGNRTGGGTTGGTAPNGAVAPLSPMGASGQPLPPILNNNNQQVAQTNLAPISGHVGTEQTNRQYLSPMAIPSAAQQSAQFAELRRRMMDYQNGHPMTDAEANHQFMAALQASRQLGGVGVAPNPNTHLVPSPSGVGEPGTTAMGARPPSDVTGAPYQIRPGVPATPGTTVPPAGIAPQPAPPAPLQVHNLEEGISAEGLKQLIAQGEDLVQKQQYAKAIEVYNESIAVAPNNPLLLIGRAEANLGASFYRQAESDLRIAFKADQALLLGQYDLQKHVGDARLQKIVADLKQIASDNPNSETPVFLLAYIAYNTHHEDQANAWLDVAQKRSNGKDDLIPLLKKFWTFTYPTTQPQDLNK